MIGIIGAMEEEISILKESMKLEEVKNIAGMEFYKGSINDSKLVIVRSGIGKVNAAVCTQLLISTFDVNCIINTGVAGGLADDIDIADVVVSTELVQYDMDATNFGYKPGEIPRMGIVKFPADKELIAKFEDAFNSLDMDIRLYKGIVASGDRFVADNKIKQEIKNNFNAACVEMEGAAIAHVAYLNHLPCLVIRTISDKANDSAGMDYSSFEKLAISNLSRLSLAMIERLARKL